MAQSTTKSRPLGKDEVRTLIDLITKKPIITTKATNASNNKLKEEAWLDISNQFCAAVGEYRRPEQLRLKWENLKKAARKRSATIRQNNLKTGGGKSYIPPDDTLDRVASILGATCYGFLVDVGGDAPVEIVEEISQEVAVSVQTVPEVPELIPVSDECVVNYDGSDASGNNYAGKNAYQPRKLNTPNQSSNKRRKLSELQIAQKEKELAMAAYFRAKAEKIELENEKLKLEIEKLKN